MTRPPSTTGLGFLTFATTDFNMYRLVLPTVVSMSAKAYANSEAKKAQTREQAIFKYQKSLELAAFVAIVGAILHSVYTAYTEGPALDRGTGAYGILGLSPSATAKDISQAFRHQSRALHPDKNPAAAAEYDLLSLANRVLKDPQLKFIYDRFGVELASSFEVHKMVVTLSQVVRAKFYSSLTYWAYSILSVALSSFFSRNSSTWQLIILLASAGLELTLTTRDWFGWYAPLPIFQCIAILRNCMPIVLGSISLIVPPATSDLDRELGALYRAVSRGKVLAEKQLDDITAPYQTDENTMRKLQSLANKALL